MKSIEVLKRLGLTEYEARAYVSLVSTGPSTAGELSKSADVPYSRIYDILSRLESRGWVEVQSGRPSRYRARPPSEVMRLLKSEEEKRLKELTTTVVQELEPLYNRSDALKKPELWIIRGWENLRSRVQQMLSKASSEVLISMPVLPMGLHDLIPLFTVLKQRNVEIQILTTEKIQVPGVEVRRRDSLFGGGLIVDGKEVLLILGGGNEVVGLWSNEIGLARFAEEYFKYLWRDSKPLK